MAAGHQSGVSDIPDGGNGLKENGLTLKPVPDCASGTGLPYAPIDWPNPGDVWGWKVGKRKNSLGYMLDRCLYPPRRFRETMEKKKFFDSLKSLKEFMRREFPNADHRAFFASFSWIVPSEEHYTEEDLYNEVVTDCSGSESQIGTKCRARNKRCRLQLEASNDSLPVMECHLCCSESGFCRDCCCILCYKSIDWSHGGYSFIRCEAKVSDSGICGHAAHIDCALRSYLAGTVGGSIGLDVEYLCRHCDNRTDLISQVKKILDTCESLESQEDIEKLLKVGGCILRDSKRENAIMLLNRIELAMAKLRSGIDLKKIWEVQDNTSMLSSVAMPHDRNNTGLSGLEDTNCQDSSEQNTHAEPLYSEFRITSQQLKEELDQVLEDLRVSQELEYWMAEERLNERKHVITTLLKQLDAERSVLANRTSSTKDSDVGALLTNISRRVNEIKREVAKLREVEEVAKGFGKTPKSVLKKHFGFQIDV